MNSIIFRSFITLIVSTIFTISCQAQQSPKTFIYQSVLGCKDNNCGEEEQKKGLIILDLAKNSIIVGYGLSASATALQYTIESKSIEKLRGKEVLKINTVDSFKDKTTFMIYKSDNSSADYALRSKYGEISSIVLCHEFTSGKSYYFYCK